MLRELSELAAEVTRWPEMLVGDQSKAHDAELEQNLWTSSYVYV
jgi:hypothetical protein